MKREIQNAIEIADRAVSALREQRADFPDDSLDARRLDREIEAGLGRIADLNDELYLCKNLTLEAGRTIMRDGKPFVQIHRCEWANVLPSPSEADEFARLAVRACNSHDGLVVALQALLHFNEELCTDVGVSKHYPSAEQARAALAKAKGETERTRQDTLSDLNAKIDFEVWRDEQLVTLRKLYKQQFPHAEVGVRHDARNGQYVGTINGRDVSPTSFDESRALEIARKIVSRYQSFPDFCRREWEKGAKCT